VTVHVNGAVAVAGVQFGEVGVRFAIVGVPGEAFVVADAAAATATAIDCVFGETNAGRRAADVPAPAEGTVTVNTA
jgi:hypothetical protein